LTYILFNFQLKGKETHRESNRLFRWKFRKKKVVGEDNMKRIITRVRALYKDKEKKENKTLHIIRDSS
jgi:hypothetical protein